MSLICRDTKEKLRDLVRLLLRMAALHANRLVPRLLQAVEFGRISTAEALKATVRGKSAMQAVLQLAHTRQPARPLARRPRRYPSRAIDGAIAAVKRRIGGRRVVRSIHWGVRQVGGRRTYQTAVVVHVVTKFSPSQLRGKGQSRLPRSVTVRLGGRRYVVPVDVQGVGTSATLHIATAEPGDHGTILVNGHALGALGAVVLGSDNRSYAVTAGHVAEAVGGNTADCRDLDAGTFRLGPVKCNRLDAGVDVAAMGPVGSVPPGAVGSETFARDATTGDLHKRVFFYLPESFTAIESHIEGVNVTGVFSTPSGTLRLTGLTSVDRMTRSGDSGAPALDVEGNLIGFVVGADATRTFLLPARRALNALEDCL